MTNLEKLTNKVLNGGYVTKEEALYLYTRPLNELCTNANIIRKHFCSNKFDICTIINGKSGKCSEDCKFCAQSSYNKTSTPQYPLLPIDKIVEDAKYNYNQGVLRYSIVTSGRKLSDTEIDEMCIAIKRIKEEIGISICVSFGLLDETQFRKLKLAGVTRVHNNIETSKNNFSNICTTHTFDEKIKTIKAAQKAGLTVCSGGIMGLGESIEDRIDMAFTLKELGIKNIPINMLNPIKGTPFSNNTKLTKSDMERIVAVYRYIIPQATIRLAGGRGLLEDKGKGCFLSGANAAISGDMLTTAGINIKTDLKIINELGYEVKLCNE